MEDSVRRTRFYRFDTFTLDARTGKLIQTEKSHHLREQPLQLLLALLEQPKSVCYLCLAIDTNHHRPSSLIYFFQVG